MTVRRARGSNARRIAGLAAMLALALPAPAAATLSVSYSIQVSATSVAVGDTLTITPVVGSAPAGTALRCFMYIEHPSFGEDWLRMRVASDGCEPWTFTVPQSPPGQYLVSGYLQFGASGVLTTTTLAGDHSLNIGPGSSAPFVSNYPVQSWDLADLVSTPTPVYGEPFTINPSAGAEGCQIRILGGFEQAHVRQADGCIPWTFSIPQWQPQGPASTFLPTADVMVLAWVGTSPYTTNTDPDFALIGAKWAETYAVNLANFESGSSTTTEYTSNLPAIFAGPQRGYTGLVGDVDPVLLAPVVVGLASGSCGYSVGLSAGDPGPSSVPVVAGGCQQPAAVPAFQGPGNAVSIVYLTLLDAQGHLVAKSQPEVGWVQPMDPLTVTAPGTVSSGTSLTIDASNDQGVPAGYEIVAAPLPAAGAPASTSSNATLPAAPTVIAEGLFNPSLSSSGDQIIVNHAFATPGTYRITATFTDVRGVTTSSSKDVNVLGATPFTDIADSPFRNDIIWLFYSGITKGCTATTFCPLAVVTRAQMAAFLDRALALPTTAMDFFTDDEGSTFENDINRVAAAGITKGCTITTFCPLASVTRGQMAAFLARALALPTTATDYFTDDEGSTFENDINRVAAAGITKGCTPTTFCPLAVVTREQMAAFLHRASQ